MAEQASSRRRQVIEVATTVIAVLVTVFVLPGAPRWAFYVLAAAFVPLFALVWWRLRK